MGATLDHARIEICGGVASGKTTLCNALVAAGANGIFENFWANPFWSLFYQAPHIYAFEAEVTFLLQHYSLIKTISPSSPMFACDFSLLQDEAYADMNLSGGHLSAFRTVYAQVVDEVRPPALIVHLQCGAGEELRRIRQRARVEEETVQLSYLDALNGAIIRAVDKACGRIAVLHIDSAALDFANNSGTQKQVVAKIFAAASRRSRQGTSSNSERV
jgi:deoxyguanosine kinase